MGDVNVMRLNVHVFKKLGLFMCKVLKYGPMEGKLECRPKFGKAYCQGIY
jgi:hypothetical protein